MTFSVGKKQFRYESLAGGEVHVFGKDGTDYGTWRDTVRFAEVYRAFGNELAMPTRVPA